QYPRDGDRSFFSDVQKLDFLLRVLEALQEQSEIRMTAELEHDAPLLVLFLGLLGIGLGLVQLIEEVFAVRDSVPDRRLEGPAWDKWRRISFGCRSVVYPQMPKRLGWRHGASLLEAKAC